MEQGRRLKVSKAEKITDKVIEEKESNNTNESIYGTGTSMGYNIY